MTCLKITSVQENPVLGDIRANLRCIEHAYQKAVLDESDLIVFSELFISGYPPEDLILRPEFTQACRQALNVVALWTQTSKTAIIMGTPWWKSEESSSNPEQGSQIKAAQNTKALKPYNAAVLIEKGRIKPVCYKHALPDYGVFDDHRIFKSGHVFEPFIFKNIFLGVMICEDLWSKKIAQILHQKGAELLISMNASPYRRGISSKRFEVIKESVQRTDLPLIYVNQYGGQDELVFDGASLSVSHSGEIIQQLPDFTSSIMTAVWQKKTSHWHCISAEKHPVKQGISADYAAILLAIRDYVHKNGYQNIILGLSGGIDSALVACLCVDALGKDHVTSFMLPSKYTSDQSLEDAYICAKRLDVECQELSIETINTEVLTVLDPLFSEQKTDITEENIQSRLRGILLMAISNKMGSLLMTTGNKSELSIGYATLYGDMCGAYNPVKDLYKTELYEMGRWRNKAGNWQNWMKGSKGSIIPERIFIKPPSAELKEGQTDQDSLPEYDLLDQILKLLIEEQNSVSELVQKGFPKTLVSEIEDKLYCSEYKRYQSAPGVKLGKCSFGRDWRYPLTHYYRSGKR